MHDLYSINCVTDTDREHRHSYDSFSETLRDGTNGRSSAKQVQAKYDSVTCSSLVHVAFFRTKGAYHELIAVTTCTSCTQVCTIQVNHSYVAWSSVLYMVLLREQSISTGVKRGSWKSGGSKTYDLPCRGHKIWWATPCPKLNIAWPWDSKNFDNFHPSRCDLVHYRDFTTTASKAGNMITYPMP